MTYEDEMVSALATFVVEGRELLEDMETALLGLEVEADPGETINAVFRAAHTIKGSSGLFGLNHLVAFTHVVESVLDRLRTQEIEVSSDLIGILLPCRDHLAALMEGIAEGRLDQNPAEAEAGAGLLAQLQPFLDDAPSAPAAEGPPAPADAGQSDGAAVAEGHRRVHASLRFGPDSLRNGMDPLAFVRYLSTLGEVAALTTITEPLPDAAAMDPECCYLGFEVTLDTTADAATIDGVFDFVREDSRIVILDPESPASDVLDLIESFGPVAERIEDILINAAVVSSAALQHARSARTGDAPPASATAPAADGAAGASAPVPAQRRPPGAKDAPQAQAETKVGENRSIRIDATRLDRLIDVVGELVIAGAGAALRASHNKDEALEGAISELMRLVEEVRDSALQLRMVPIGTTFSRFQRVVRDVSAALGKDVALTITGGDTEVDKALVEKIGDPLMHLVRNSLDHGIESAELRQERGKPIRGTLRLNAFHDSGSIVIEVSDDGGGIDVSRVLARAIERGLVEPGAALSEKEVFGLLFEPGFSTAEQVSDLSGRGVGMDVVKRNVASLRGTIDVESQPGAGTTMRLRLPLTLAIIDGFLVGVGGSTFVIPLDRVVECVELPSGSDSRDCMDLRGEVLPFIRLRSLFGMAGERPRRENVVVVEYAGAKTGMVVDTLVGEFQTVIKPLGRLFSHIQGIGGSTILGNGEVALIIDVPMMVRRYTDRDSGTPVTSGVGQ